MHQAHGGLCVALLLGVFLCHVLEPGQPQIRRRLVTLGNSEDRVRKCQGQLVNHTDFLLCMATFSAKDFVFPRVLPTCSEYERKGQCLSGQLLSFHVQGVLDPKKQHLIKTLWEKKDLIK